MIDSLICLLSLFPVDSTGVVHLENAVYVEVKTIEGISSGWFNVECVKINKDDYRE